MKKTFLYAVLALIVVIIAIMFFSKEEQSDYVVRIGHLKGTIATLPGEVMKVTSYLEEVGLAYEFVDVASSNQGYEATVRGDIDVLPLVSFLPVAQNYYKQQDAVKVFGVSRMRVEDKYDYILVKKDSSIQSIQDMSGKTLKYGLFPGSTHTVFTKLYLEKMGVDISKIEFIQLPPANHLQALEAGSVDVLGTYDPMATAGLATGNYRVIDYSVYAHDLDKTPIAAGIVNTKFATEHTKEMRDFFEAYDNVYDAIQSDSELVASTLEKEFGFTPEVARSVPIPQWLVSPEIDAVHFQKFVDRLAELKEIEKPFPVEDILIK